MGYIFFFFLESLLQRWRDALGPGPEFFNLAISTCNGISAWLWLATAVHHFGTYEQSETTSAVPLILLLRVIKSSNWRLY